MEMSIPIYRKRDQWYRSVTEIPRDEGEIGDFPRYDERIYVEIPGYCVPIDLTLDKLIEMHEKLHWGKTGGMGLKSGPYKLDTHVACLGHEDEVRDRGKNYGFEVYCAV